MRKRSTKRYDGSTEKGTSQYSSFEDFQACFCYVRVMSDAYEQLRDEVDRLARRLSDRYSIHLECRSGCSGCCRHHLSVFRVEADRIAHAIADLPEETRSAIEARAAEIELKEARGEEVSCPLLVEDRCSIYESRPLICRTQGLPLIYETDEEEQEVDFCPLNFTAPDALDDLDEEHLVPLDAINLRLAMINLDFCLKSGIDGELAGQRIKMNEIINSKK